jgi:hypothetical protein
MSVLKIVVDTIEWLLARIWPVLLPIGDRHFAGASDVLACSQVNLFKKKIFLNCLDSLWTHTDIRV